MRTATERKTRWTLRTEMPFASFSLLLVLVSSWSALDSYCFVPLSLADVSLADVYHYWVVFILRVCNMTCDYLYNKVVDLMLIEL